MVHAGVIINVDHHNFSSGIFVMMSSSSSSVMLMSRYSNFVNPVTFKGITRLISIIYFDIWLSSVFLHISLQVQIDDYICVYLPWVRFFGKPVWFPELLVDCVRSTVSLDVSSVSSVCLLFFRVEISCGSSDSISFYAVFSQMGRRHIL